MWSAGPLFLLIVHFFDIMLLKRDLPGFNAQAATQKQARVNLLYIWVGLPKCYDPWSVIHVSMCPCVVFLDIFYDVTSHTMLLPQCLVFRCPLIPLNLVLLSFPPSFLPSPSSPFRWDRDSTFWLMSSLHNGDTEKVKKEAIDPPGQSCVNVRLFQ